MYKKRQVDSNQLAFFCLETDLAFSPTLACWRFRSGSHHYFSLSIFSAGLTSKTRHAHFVHFWQSLRGSFCPRLAWTCSHRLSKLFYFTLSSLLLSNKSFSNMFFIHACDNVTNDFINICILWYNLYNYMHSLQKITTKGVLWLWNLKILTRKRFLW